MNDILRMAHEAGFSLYRDISAVDGSIAHLKRFAELVAAAKREQVAAWMMQRGYATGHGDTIEGLLEEFKREASFDRAGLWIKRINEAVLAEREACAKLVEGLFDDPNDAVLEFIVDAIRARGQA